MLLWSSLFKHKVQATLFLDYMKLVLDDDEDDQEPNLSQLSQSQDLDLSQSQDITQHDTNEVAESKRNTVKFTICLFVFQFFILASRNL